MALIKWDENFSVGVTEIDREHQNLIMIINDLSNAMKQGAGKKVIGGILKELTTYSITHFKHEEDYFDQYEYPESDIHKQEHAFYREKISEFEDDFKNGRLALSIEVIYFLSDWWASHITITDKKYSDFFHAKGLN